MATIPFGKLCFVPLARPGNAQAQIALKAPRRLAHGSVLGIRTLERLERLGSFGGGNALGLHGSAEEFFRSRIQLRRRLLGIHEVFLDIAIAAEVAQLVSREMEGIAALRVPLTAEAKWGESWYDTK